MSKVTDGLIKMIVNESQGLFSADYLRHLSGQQGIQSLISIVRTLAIMSPSIAAATGYKGPVFQTSGSVTATGKQLSDAMDILGAGTSIGGAAGSPGGGVDLSSGGTSTGGGPTGFNMGDGTDSTDYTDQYTFTPDIPTGKTRERGLGNGLFVTEAWGVRPGGNPLVEAPGWYRVGSPYQGQPSDLQRSQLDVSQYNALTSRGSLALAGARFGLSQSEFGLSQSKFGWDQQLDTAKLQLDLAKFAENQNQWQQEFAMKGSDATALLNYRNQQIDLQQAQQHLNEQIYQLSIQKQRFDESQAYAALAANPRNFRQLEALQFANGGGVANSGSPLQQLVQSPDQALPPTKFGQTPFTLTEQEKLLQAGQPFKPFAPLAGEIRLPSAQQYGQVLSPFGQDMLRSTFSAQGIPDSDLLYQIQRMSDVGQGQSQRTSYGTSRKVAGY